MAAAAVTTHTPLLVIASPGLQSGGGQLFIGRLKTKRTKHAKIGEMTYIYAGAGRAVLLQRQYVSAPDAIFRPSPPFYFV